MHRCINFFAQDLLGAFDGQTRHLLAQCFARFHGFWFGLGLGGGNDLGAFFGGLAFGFFNDLLRQALGVGQAFGSVVAR